MLRKCPVAVGLLFTGALSLGCAATGSGSASSASPVSGALKVHVATVSPTPTATDGAPVEHVTFTVSGATSSSMITWFRCSIEVLHAGHRVGATSITAGGSPGFASTTPSLGVLVKGGSFAGKPSDADVACRSVSHSMSGH